MVTSASRSSGRPPGTDRSWSRRPGTSTFCMPVYFFHPLLAIFLDFSRSAFNLLVNGFLDWHRNSWKQRGKPFKLSEEGTKHLPYGHNATPTCLHIQVLQNTSKKYPDGQKYSLLIKKKKMLLHYCPIEVS